MVSVSQFLLPSGPWLSVEEMEKFWKGSHPYCFILCDATKASDEHSYSRKDSLRSAICLVTNSGGYGIKAGRACWAEAHGAGQLDSARQDARY